MFHEVVVSFNYQYVKTAKSCSFGNGYSITKTTLTLLNGSKKVEHSHV